MLAFGIQIPSPVLRLAAVLSFVTDRSVQSGFSFFDGVLAIRPIIGMDARRRHK